MVFTLNFLFIKFFFFLNFPQVLDSTSLTVCPDIVFWLLALNELQKVVLF